MHYLDKKTKKNLFITEFFTHHPAPSEFFLQFLSHNFSAENILHFLFLYTPGLLNNYLENLSSKSFFLKMPKIFLYYLKNALKSSNFCINFYVHQLDTPSHHEAPEFVIISKNFCIIFLINWNIYP